MFLFCVNAARNNINWTQTSATFGLFNVIFFMDNGFIGCERTLSGNCT